MKVIKPGKVSSRKELIQPRISHSAIQGPYIRREPDELCMSLLECVILLNKAEP